MTTSPCLAGALSYGKCAGKAVFLWYALLRRLRTAHRVFQCDSDAIWTFNARKVQKHNVSSVKDGSWDCAIRMRPLPGRLDLLSFANFAQSRQRLPKNTMLSGLRGEVTPGRFFRTRDETAGAYPWQFASNSNFVSHLFGVPEAINMYHRWGPSARNNITFARDRVVEQQYEVSVRRAAVSFAADLPVLSPRRGARFDRRLAQTFLYQADARRGRLVNPVNGHVPHVQLIILMPDLAWRLRNNSMNLFQSIRAPVDWTGGVPFP